LAARVILHADFDYFYAQCEENANPNIRDKPVVVCVYSGRTEDSGVVSTSNYEAREYGVKAGVPIVRAKKLLEKTEAVFLPMNRPMYEQVSDRIMQMLKVEGDACEKVGIDEAYVDITTRTNADFDLANQVAIEIKQKIFTREHITCSIGIAPNKLVAKIASDHVKPNGLTIVKPEEVVSFLATMPVSRIPGVGKKVEEKLSDLHVVSVSELTGVDSPLLIETFGKSLGNYLYQAARGLDDEPVKEREQPGQFSRIGTLKKNTRELDEIRPLLFELADSVNRKLAEKNMLCRSISVIAILSDLSIHTKSKSFETPTANERIIIQSSKEILEQILQSMPTAILRRVGVKLSGLSKPEGQMDISHFLQAQT
jgi:DNA polymerase IV (DinB-like DNA polymerase)